MSPRPKLLVCALLLVLSPSAARSQKPEVVVQTGHTSEVEAVAFSPDGRTLASAGADNTTRLWDVETGRELAALGHDLYVYALAFSPDGRLLASGEFGGDIRIRDAATGKLLQTFAEPDAFGAEEVRSVAFSPDGRLVAGSLDKAVTVWDVSTGKIVRRFVEKDDETNFQGVAFSPDGKYLATGGTHLRVWSVATGRLSKTVRNQYAASLAWSPDGATLAAVGPDLSINLWSARGPALKLVRTLKGHTADINSLAFSPDGRTLASAGGDPLSERPDYTVRLWDVTTGRLLKTFEGHAGDVTSVAFNPRLGVVASASRDATVKLWDVTTGKEYRQLRRSATATESLVFSGKYLIGSSSDGRLRLWDTSAGTLRTLTGHHDEESDPSAHGGGTVSVAVIADGKTIASNLGRETKIWDVESGGELRRLDTLNDAASLAFGPDGRLLARGEKDRATLWDAQTGKLLRVLPGDAAGSSLGTGSRVAFVSGGQFLALKQDDKPVQVFDLASGRVKSTCGSGFGPFAVSPDGRTMANVNGVESLQLCDVETGRLVSEFTDFTAGGSGGGFGNVDDITFSPDGRLVVFSTGFEAHVWSVERGARVRVLAGHTARIRSLAFSPDGKLLATGGDDAKVKLWEVGKGAELATLVALGESDWVAAAPDGLFDGTPRGYAEILWRFSENLSEVEPVEKFFAEFYRPGLLSEIFAGRRPHAAQDIAQKDRRQPVLTLTRADSDARGAQTNEQGARTIKVRIALKEVEADAAKGLPASGVRDVRLFRNGTLVKSWRGDLALKGGSATLEATLTAVAGENRLTAYAFNRDNVKSADATLDVSAPESLRRRGVVYVVAVGVNVYANPQFNLKYAVADAEAFAAALKDGQEKLGRFERVEVVRLFDAEATKANLLAALAALASKVGPEDFAVVYFAGHGMARGNSFYLIPHDLGYEGPRTSAAADALAAHGVSDRELEDAFERLDAAQVVLVIDACNSGQALEAEEHRRGPMNSKGLAQLAYEKGMYVLTAAQSYQAALEASELGHGLLTYALVEAGLRRGEADRVPADGQILLREWLDFAAEVVPRMQLKKMRECRDVSSDECAVVEGEEQITDLEKRSLQRPRVFYRREPEAQPFVVARTGGSVPQE